MTEAETIEQLIGFTNILIGGLSVYFTLVSAYIAALNYFVRRAGFVVRVGAFFFFSFVLALLALVMVGAQRTQWGLVEHLRALGAEGALTRAGEAVLANAENAPILAPGFALDQLWREHLSVDSLVMSAVWLGFLLTYAALFLMTFVFRWGEGARDGA